MKHVGLTNNYLANVKWSWIYFIVDLTLYSMSKNTYLEKHTSHKHQKSCWKSTHYANWLWNYCTVGTTVLKNIVARKEEKQSHKVSHTSNLQLKQMTIQEDHNNHVYSLFCLVVLAVKNSKKPLLLVMYRNQVFLCFHL